ncbi:MAG: hypothetical protein K2X99_13170 [Gemmatimonadaceae bacterium]|nr:hypothetical protein [Gemmatimonadaceae bacterium]
MSDEHDSGHRAAAAPRAVLAALADRYRVDRELGGGGMSRVFLAREVGLNRDVVIKVLPDESPRA